MAEYQYDLFISYQSIDEPFAKQLVEGLKHACGENVTVFYAPLDIQLGDNIVMKIDQALQSAKFFVMILSPEYLSADWTTAERSAAIYADPSGRNGRIIPVLYRKCQLPPLLRYRKYIDVGKYGLNFAVELIATIVDKGYPALETQKQFKAFEGTGESDIASARRVLDSLEPDNVSDSLFTNIFPVKETPKYVWSAPTKLRTPVAILRYFGPDAFVSPFILFHDRICTFADLSREDNSFSGVIETYEIKKEGIDAWTSDVERNKMLHWLFDDCLREKLRSIRMTYERRGKRYYFEKGTLKIDKFKAFAKGGGKNLIIDYTKRGGNYVAYRAVDLRFILIGMSPFLRINPGWIFKNASGDIISGKRRIVLNAKFTSRQRNASSFNEIRFWTWFLSDNDHVIRLPIEKNTDISIDVEMRPIEVSFGILGDRRNISPTEAPPDLKFEDEKVEEEILAEDEDSEEDE